MHKQRVIAYIDGFNLFYSCLKGTNNKWLDLWSLCESLLLPNQELIEIRYFSAPVGSFRGDSNRSNRQHVYLEALQVNQKIIVKLGYFSVHKIKAPLASDWDDGRITQVEVVKTEEKGSDVNLAVQMAVDAVRNRFDYAMLFSNDSDMAYSVQIAVAECNKKVGLYIDNKAKSYRVLRENVHYVRKLTQSFLARHQLPDEIVTKTGRVIKKPQDW